VQVVLSLNYKMKILKSVTVLAVLFLLGIAGQVQAQATGGNKAKFIRPIGIQAVNDAAGATINFGVLVPNGSGGTVFVSHDNYPSGSYGSAGGAGAIMLTHDAPVAHAADFTITGEPNYVYEITTSNPMTLSLLDGSATMQLTWGPAYVMVGGPTAPPIYGQNSDPFVYNNWLSNLNAAGNGRISQGATLTVSAHQAPGLYTAQWFETVTYN
jgi:hypothetical protein